jgi:hypothetical protein
MFAQKMQYGQDPDVVVRSKTTFAAPLKWLDRSLARRSVGHHPPHAVADLPDPHEAAGPDLVASALGLAHAERLARRVH